MDDDELEVLEAEPLPSAAFNPLAPLILLFAVFEDVLQAFAAFWGGMSDFLMMHVNKQITDRIAHEEFAVELESLPKE